MQSDAATIEVRSRAAIWARANWKQHAEKMLQAELDITESQAERILMGRASRPLIDAMLAKWKWSFAHFVLEPLCGSISQAAVDETLAAAETSALATIQRIRQLRGAPPLTVVEQAAAPGRMDAARVAGVDPAAPEAEQPAVVRRAGGAR